MLNLFSREGIISLIVSIPGLLLAISMHEAAHGYAAYLMGDRTAKYQGRLSLNPIKHLDPLGAICMLLFRFGWAKPVPIDSRYFKNQKSGIILVSLAGPAANFLLGLISWFGLYGANFLAPNNSFGEFIAMVFLYSAYMNVGLMLFNLIPVPPLDGSKVLMEFLPYRIKYHIYRYERYFSLILLLLIYSGIITPVLYVLRNYVVLLYDICASSIFSLFI